MLSQSNIDNLHMKGLYKVKESKVNNVKFENKYFTFKPIIRNNNYYMQCSLSKELIELSDNNYSDFIVICKDIRKSIKNRVEKYLSELDELN